MHIPDGKKKPTTKQQISNNLSSEIFKVGYLASQLSLLLSDKAIHHLHLGISVPELFFYRCGCILPPADFTLYP